MESFAVGFARPDRRSWHGTSEQTPWHAVVADRPARDLDGVVDLALCGAVVQIWGSQRWERMGTGRTACAECVRLSTAPPLLPAPASPAPASPAGAAPVPARLLRAV
ncbi:hypothetical protein [Trujillonella humicola]|uniref:hypothetical protein n=1 Tax=Trujillonella humicola TaxID=3383699 RepID=UPI0039057A6D